MGVRFIVVVGMMMRSGVREGGREGGRVDKGKRGRGSQILSLGVRWPETPRHRYRAHGAGL